MFPASEDERAIRIELFDDEGLESLYIDHCGARLKITASSYICSVSLRCRQDNLKRAIEDIEIELSHRLNELEQTGKLVEKQRLEERTNYDLDMLRNAGFCSRGLDVFYGTYPVRSPAEDNRRHWLEYFSRRLALGDGWKSRHIAHRVLGDVQRRYEVESRRS